MVLDSAAHKGCGPNVVDMDFRDEVQVGAHTYGVNAKSDPGDGEQPPAVAIEFTGADQDGRILAEGNLLIAIEGITDAGRFLAQTLDGLAALHGKRAPSRAGVRARSRAPNAGAPWTDQLSAELREQWMHGDAGTGSELLAELAQRFGRSRVSLRAQLARLGCDPDVPGRSLTDTAES